MSFPVKLHDGTPIEQMVSNQLYHVIAGNGTFMHLPTALGSAFLPVYTKPDGIPDLGNKVGYNNAIFQYTHGLFPVWIVAQSYDFFRRIYEKNHSEACVILTYNPKAENPYRLFVPPQKVSHGGVQSAFDPEHIARGWQTIGSLHSHCDFSAFHSGTDTGDADDFNGVHMTIGNILHEKVEFACMVSANKKRFDYVPETVFAMPDFADYANWPAEYRAPAWWDRYVIDMKDSPATDKIKATFAAQTPTRHDTKPTAGFQSPSSHWGNGSKWQHSSHPASTPPYNSDRGLSGQRHDYGSPEFPFAPGFSHYGGRYYDADYEIPHWGMRGMDAPRRTFPSQPAPSSRKDRSGVHFKGRTINRRKGRKLETLIADIYQRLDELYDQYGIDFTDILNVDDEDDLMPTHTMDMTTGKIAEVPGQTMLDALLPDDTAEAKVEALLKPSEPAITLTMKEGKIINTKSGESFDTIEDALQSIHSIPREHAVIPFESLGAD